MEMPEELESQLLMISCICLIFELNLPLTGVPATIALKRESKETAIWKYILGNDGVLQILD
jgi:hypothetical protein